MTEKQLNKANEIRGELKELKFILCEIGDAIDTVAYCHTLSDIAERLDGTLTYIVRGEETSRPQNIIRDAIMQVIENRRKEIINRINELNKEFEAL